MTQIDFYLLADSDPAARLRFACRLTEQIWSKQRRPVYLHLDSAPAAHELDALLWQFRPDSFVPHDLLQAGANPAPPVQIGYGDDPGPHHDVLINLSLTIPDFFSRFERVVEIICQQDNVLSAKRRAWKFYKDRGYPLRQHDLRQKSP